MSRKLNSFLATIFISACFILDGCATAASGRQYIPAAAEKLDTSELALVTLSNPDPKTLTPQNITLNGVAVKKNTIYLIPGEYVLEYSIEKITKELESFQQQMARDGYTFTYGQVVCKSPITNAGGLAIAVVGGSCKKFDGISEPADESRVLNLEGGKTYSISEW